jgi:hypothetical protein
MFSLLRMMRLFDVGCADTTAATPAPTSQQETTGVDAGCSVSGAKEAWSFGDDNTIVKQNENWMRAH